MNTQTTQSSRIPYPEEYHRHISAEHRWFDLKLKEVIQYRDLIRLFVTRSFVVGLKQTILGPLWLFIRPLITTVMHMIVFGNIAKLSTDGLPALLFYFVGTAVWELFSGCLNGNAGIFIGNAHLFGKVYFPRLTVPISNVIGNMIRMLIQLSLVAVLMVYYICRGMVLPRLHMIWVIPLVMIELGILGAAVGMFISSITTKYRDLSALVGLGVSLWMYATPVVYPLTQLAPGWIRTVVLWNPVTAPMELFRWAVLGQGTVMPGRMLFSWAVTLLIALFGILVFNRVERNFLDTV